MVGVTSHKNVKEINEYRIYIYTGKILKKSKNFLF